MMGLNSVLYSLLDFWHKIKKVAKFLPDSVKMIIVMFNKNGPKSEQSPERANLERQKRKLTGFYLSGGDERYIFESDSEPFKEDKVTAADEAEVLNVLQNDPNMKDREWRLLVRMAGPGLHLSDDEMFGRMAGDKHQKRILAYMTGVDWNGYNATSGQNVADFLSRYPTPMDFDEHSEDFLRMIGDYNGEEKAREYDEAMESFKLGMYGKKYEYYKAMREFHQEAEERQTRDAEQAREATRRGRRFFEIFNKGELIRDSGLAMVDKGTIAGEQGRQNEDAAYYNPALGLFAVFDGAGGMGGAARASELGVEATNQMISQKVPERAEDLADILRVASDAIKHDPAAGYSTGVIGKIVEREGKKSLMYASVGDSRIYVVRGKEAIQLTQDEGWGNKITNSLGLNECRVKQMGEFSLRGGDRIVFCSDGITGDYEPDFIPDDEFARIVKKAATADLAAWALANRATKRDDRTAIVVQV
ncbi:hypothetical protein G3RUM_00278 [Candidatus Nanosyncoccus alces]|uniref:PPM-type phosphatase domain-containing protein n=2 Tax=Candidatus Nanosyncoccus alces TaxID=2171997 RepID=A0ABY0FMB6_9BACT|nr:hypothetical protein G3RUM_00278 [Candidatus Nanosyncoccus alces]